MESIRALLKFGMTFNIYLLISNLCPVHIPYTTHRHSFHNQSVELFFEIFLLSYLGKSQKLIDWHKHLNIAQIPTKNSVDDSLESSVAALTYPVFLLINVNICSLSGQSGVLFSF